MDFLGIDFDGTIVNLALIDSQQKIIRLTSCSLLDVKPLYIRKLKNLKKTIFVSALSDKQVLIKQKILKLTSKNALKKAIPFQLKSSSALPQEHSIALPFISHATKDSSEISFFITTKKSIANHLELLIKADISPDYLSFQSQALNRFAEYNFPATRNIFLLHMGKSQTIIAYVKNGVVKGHYTLKMGSLELCSAYGKEYSDKNTKNSKIDFSNVFAQNSSPFGTSINVFACEIKKALLSFMPTSNPEKTPILLSGQINSFLGFDEFVLSHNSELISESLKIKEITNLPHAISIGLGLDGMAKDLKSIQFLQEEFVPQKHLKKVGMSLLIILLSSLVITVGGYFASKTIYLHRQNNLFYNLSIIEKTEKPIADQPCFLSFEARQKALDEKIKKELKSSPYICVAPKVSKFLEWLNKHPLIETAQNDAVQVLSFDYEIIDAPNIEVIKKTYSAKVSLSLKINDPSYAKKFYDSLSNYPNFIDMSKEICWDEDNSNYTLSFFLKNLTPSEFYDR